MFLACSYRGRHGRKDCGVGIPSLERDDSGGLTDWPAGGFVGIRGTNRPELLPGRVSHGCIRFRNEDIRELARLMPIGTPITIR